MASTVPVREPIYIRPVGLHLYQSDLPSIYPFLDTDVKQSYPVPQPWERLKLCKLLRHPTVPTMLVEGLVADRGLDAYIFKISIAGKGPYALKVFKHILPDGDRWPLHRECMYYATTEAINAGVVAGKPLPVGTPPDFRMAPDLLGLLFSFASDRNCWIAPDGRFGDQTELRELAAEMDGSQGWTRIHMDDMNRVLYEWELKRTGAMNGAFFHDHPFAIVKKWTPRVVPMDPRRMILWLDLAEYLGFHLHTFKSRSWVGPAILVDANDVLTLPFERHRRVSSHIGHRHYREMLSAMAREGSAEAKVAIAATPSDSPGSGREYSDEESDEDTARAESDPESDPESEEYGSDLDSDPDSDPDADLDADLDADPDSDPGSDEYEDGDSNQYSDGEDSESEREDL